MNRIYRVVIFATLAIPFSLSSHTAFGQETTRDPDKELPAKRNQRITLQFKHPKPVTILLEHFEERSGVAIHCDEDNLSGVLVTCNFKDLHWREALFKTALEYELLVIDEPDGGLVVACPSRKDPCVGSPVERLARLAGFHLSEGFLDFVEHFDESKCSIDYLEEILSICEKDGGSIYDPWEALEFFKAGCSPLFVAGLSKLIDPGECPLFYSSEILAYRETGAPSKFACALFEIRDADGAPRFDAFDMIELARGQVPIEYAARMASFGVDAVVICYHHLLGLEPQGRMAFEDTDRPNALIVLPWADPEGKCHSEGIRDLARRLRNRYDSFFLFACREEQILEAMRTLPEIDLLLLCGQGTRTRLVLGSCGNWKEDEAIDLSDTDLGAWACHLRRGGLCILHGDVGGEGGSDAVNLASAMHRFLRGQIAVIASRTPFETREIHLDGLSTSIRSEENTVRISTLVKSGEER